MKIRPEDPLKIELFRTGTENLQWNDDSFKESADQLFHAVDLLANDEVNYYFRRRNTRAFISGITRIFAWTFGSLAIVAPFLFQILDAGTESNNLAWGYLFFTVAAASLAANALFGGTNGHVRFVMTQLEIENLMTATRIAWAEYLSKLANEENMQELRSEAFKIIQGYAASLHELTIAETNHWGETILSELQKYSSKLNSKK